MAKYLRFLLGEHGNARYEVVLKRASLEEMWQGALPVVEEGRAKTAYTADEPKMGLGFFVLARNGRRFVFHDGDQGGFSAEMLFDPEEKLGSLLIVNTTDEGGAPASETSHAVTNTEPDAETDLRQKIRGIEIERLFPLLAQK
jgi:hypothetical protein